MRHESCSGSLMHHRQTFLALALLVFAATSAHAQATKTFDLTASRFTFVPSLIEVDEGDRVIVRLRSLDVEHGFAIRELKVHVVVPAGGETVTAEFTAPAAGTYVFACSEY